MSYGSMLHIPLTNYQLLAVKQEPHQKANLFNKKILKNFPEKKIRKMGQYAKERQALGICRRQRDSKVESNDSPEISDRGPPWSNSAWPPVNVCSQFPPMNNTA